MSIEDKKKKKGNIFLDLSAYEKQKKVGHGSYGEVYKVTEKLTGKIYAAKISKEKLKKHEKGQIRQIKREINIMAQLNHPSIPKFIGYNPQNFEHKSKPVIITEYCSNGSLKDIIDLERQSKPPSLWNSTKKLINIFGIASAMSYLHSHNIIHRDLKPANILEDDYLFPKITDFGLSKNYHQNIESMTNQSSSRCVKGTTFYIAPEIILEYKYTKACDVYAFAFIVYEIMTHEIPFEDYKNQFFLFFDVCTYNRRPKLNETIPSCYKNLIEKCWVKDPSERPTFDMIVDELKNNEEFITSDVNKEEYFDYIDLIENSHSSFDTYKKFRRITISKPHKINTKNEWNSFEENYHKSLKYRNSIPDEFKKNCSFDIKKINGIQIRQRSEFEINPKIIGKGKFGIVREATDHLNNQKVAFKELYLIDENEKMIIFKEIQILAKNDHYAIQKLYGYIEENENDFRSPVLLTLFNENDCLEKFIQKKLPDQDFTQKFIIMYGIASGLNYLHNKKIIHGKINPKSILINEKMEPIITNFDQSQKAENRQIFQSIMFDETIYTAPELLKMENDENISLYRAKASDVYSFSLIIYYIFTGERPWNNFKQTKLLPSKIIAGVKTNTVSSIGQVVKISSDDSDIE